MLEWFCCVQSAIVHCVHSVTLSLHDKYPSISCHKHGVLFNVLHNEDVEGDIVHLSWKGINSTQGFSCHIMCIDCISVHIPAWVNTGACFFINAEVKTPRFLNSIRPFNT